MSNLIVLKIGGSVLTLKEKNRPVFRNKIATRVAREIGETLTIKKSKLVIVLGTGSFGHPVAKKYRLNEGIVSQDSIWGFAQSKRQDFLVANYFWRVLEIAGIPAVIIQTSAITISKNTRILSMYTKLIKEMLAKDLAVVMFGDEVIDVDIGISVCSSDQVAAYIAKKFRATKLLYASDVDGVYESNPKLKKDAKKIIRIDNNNRMQVIGSMEQHNLLDVSNEMSGKIQAISDAKLSHKTKTEIFSGLIPGRVKQALIGGEVGTRFELGS